MIIKDDADSLVSRQIQCQFDAGLQLAKSLEKPSIYVDDAVKFNPNSSTIIVSMNLPIRVERNPSYEIDNPNSEKWLFEVDDKGL